MATPARTVSKSLGKSFKNTLDLPFKLKWPSVSHETAADVLSELVRALSGVKFSSTNKKQRQGRKRPNEDGEDVRSQPKRRRVGEGEMGTLSGEKPPTTPPEKEVTSSNSEEEVVAKRSQIVVGVNEVTRGLEKATLRVAIVCLSVKSALLHDHLQVLAATRNTPCIALSGVSDAVAPAIGLKRATTIGVKKLTKDGEVDYFSKLVDLISNRAPKINIPWLQAPTSARTATNSQARESNLQHDSLEDGKRQTETDGLACKADPQEVLANENRPVSQYLPLAIKKTIITPKRNKR